MRPTDFAEALSAEVLDANISAYSEIFETTAPDQAADPYWRDALSFWAELPGEKRALLLRMLRQATADTISNVLGILDGVTSADRFPDLTLAAEDGKPINGDLQGLFLALEEARQR